MPSKAKKKEQATSKKAEQKRKQKAIEDRTFGLKNKNKSKKVQQYVEGVSKNVMNGGMSRQERQVEEARKKAKADMKAAKKAKEEEQNALFGAALLAVKKKGKQADQKSGKVEAKGRDANDDAGKKGTSRAMKMMYQMDAKEMEERLKEDPNYVPTLEDKIEAERQKKVQELKASGKGTKITPESFAIWQEKKRKIRADKAKKLVEAELRKKKGGKGLSVLSGKDLFNYKKELFNVEDNDQTANEGDEQQKQQQQSTTNGDEPKQAATDKDDDINVDEVVEKVQTDLFLEGDDDDLDDLEDD